MSFKDADGVWRLRRTDTSRPFAPATQEHDHYSEHCAACFLGHTHSVDLHNMALAEHRMCEQAQGDAR